VNGELEELVRDVRQMTERSVTVPEKRTHAQHERMEEALGRRQHRSELMGVQSLREEWMELQKWKEEYQRVMRILDHLSVPHVQHFRYDSSMTHPIEWDHSLSHGSVRRRL
jgi:5'-deoxynucleotidase YfbR-like HD superfamily hydrolase